MKETRLYTLFEKRADGTWRQMFDWGLKKSAAVRTFQNALLAPFMSGGTIPERKLGLLKQKPLIGEAERQKLGIPE